MSKGGGASGPSEVTQVTSSLPEYARPYYEQLLTRTVGEATRPFVGYGGQRLAEFTPQEQAAMANIQGMGRPEQLGQASDIARTIGGGAAGPTGADIAAGFRPGQYQQGYQAGNIALSAARHGQ